MYDFYSVFFIYISGLNCFGMNRNVCYRGVSSIDLFIYVVSDQMMDYGEFFVEFVMIIFSVQMNRVGLIVCSVVMNVLYVLVQEYQVVFMMMYDVVFVVMFIFRMFYIFMYKDVVELYEVDVVVDDYYQMFLFVCECCVVI